MSLPRASGILLHPTSLPGSGGIGTIGEPARKFIDWLCDHEQTLWQMLPIGPTGYGNSPYASSSTFAGNPLLIDLDALVLEGFLDPKDIEYPKRVSKNGQSNGYVDFETLIPWKNILLKKAAHTFKSMGEMNSDDYKEFMQSESTWLMDFSLFSSIKRHYDEQAQHTGSPSSIWYTYWPKELRQRQQEYLTLWKNQHQDEINDTMIIQFFFFSQWKALREYAANKHVLLIGDIPIFVASDSADAWSNQRLFQLDEAGSPQYVAGVPPDYFSATGQLWGNPLYDWDRMRQEDFHWWKARIKHACRFFNYIRIDHFRGFEAYWSIPAGSATAESGDWRRAPGRDFFRSLSRDFSELPFLAEDLGVITPEVASLRDEFNLPGMKVLQFGFDESENAKGRLENPFLPHNYGTNCIAYTGTHDNDTTKGWIRAMSPSSRNTLKRYISVVMDKHPIEMLFRTANRLVMDCLRIILGSTAAFAIIPAQDLLCLDSRARMNTPSTAKGNWSWRLTSELPQNRITDALRSLSRYFNRNGGRQP